MTKLALLLKKWVALPVAVLTLYTPIGALSDPSGSGSISIYDENTWYWEYQGEPVLLIGGTNDDNLFQWEEQVLTEHLDRLAGAGGNYVRNTMSDRDAENDYAFQRVSDGQYDLAEWNPTYWEKLTFFLEETHKRDVIVQLTLWDVFDLSGHAWNDHPWNPENNINIGRELWDSREEFFSTIDDDDDRGMDYQKRFVDKILSVSLQYGNVIYNINNESRESDAWENFWAQYIKEKADELGKVAYVTTMQFDPMDSVRHAMTHRDIYSFVEISQNNQDSRGGRGAGHWDNLMYIRNKIANAPGGPMPMNNVKVYGGADGESNYSAGSETEAVNRFWRNIFAGSASARFHRPAPPRIWGSGLNDRTEKNIKAVNMLLEELDLYSSSPHNDLLVPRAQVPSSMEAYVTANIGKQYAVYFPQGRFTVDLDPWVYVDQVKVRWLDIDNLSWSKPETVQVRWEGSATDWGDRGRITLTTPSNRSYVALLEVVK